MCVPLELCPAQLFCPIRKRATQLHLEMCPTLLPCWKMCPILLSCWKRVLPYCRIGNVPPFLLLEMCPALLSHCKYVLHFFVPLEMCPISLSHWKCALFYCPVRNVPHFIVPLEMFPQFTAPVKMCSILVGNVPHLVSWWKCAPLYYPAGICPALLPQRKCVPLYCPSGNVPCFTAPLEM